MGLETATYTKDLNINNPTSTDSVTQGDDHLRLIKKVVLNSFPDIDRALPMRDFVEPSGVIKMWAGDVTQIPDGYILCDKNRTINNSSGWYGIDTTLDTASANTSGGIIIPDLADRFILGAGETTGNRPEYVDDVLVTTEEDVSVPLGQDDSEHWRTVEEIPTKTHTHEMEHTHEKGTMNITGSFGADDRMQSGNSGAFSQGSSADTGSEGRGGGYKINFNAIHSWTGETSGAMQDGELSAETTTFKDTVSLLDIKPRYYALAYIIKD